MKKFLLASALAAIGCVSALAAEYVPMIREGRVWEYTGYSTVYDGAAFHYMKFDGTETVDGTEYHRFVQFKSLVFGENRKLAYSNNSVSQVYYLREEPGKVFVLCEKNSGKIVNQEIASGDSGAGSPEYSEFKVYDFTLSDGATWEYPQAAGFSGVEGGMSLDVKWETPVEIDGEQCRVMGFSNLYVMGEDDILYFIEGIGTTCNGILPAPNMDSVSGVWDNTKEASIQSWLNRVFDSEGNVIYNSKEPTAPPANCGYAPIIEEGKVWQYGSTSMDGVTYYSKKFDGTVTVNGKEYHRFMGFQSEDYRGTSEYGVLEYAGKKEQDVTSDYMREEDGKVYVLTLDDVEFMSNTASLDPSVPEDRYGEFLRYDFTLEDGDSFMFRDRGGEYIPVVVKIKEPVLVNGTERKAMTFLYEIKEDNGDGEVTTSFVEIFPGSVIEGVGPDSDGDLIFFGPPYTTGMPEASSGLGSRSFLKYVADSEGNVIYGSRLAQSNEDPHSILGPGKMWKWEFISSVSEPERSTVTASVEDKQLYIGNRPARRVSVVSDAGMFEPFTVVLSESRGLLEFYWSDNLSGTYAYFTPVMDFSLVKGEAVYAEEGGSDWLVGRVSSVFNETVCGIDRKYQRIESQNTDRSFVWVDGVGAQYTDEYMTIFPQADCGNSFGGMLECYENGVCVFKAEDFARGQNSVEGVFDSETETVKSGATYDLMGRRVERVLPGSVYVRDGKKFVGK